MNNLFCTRHYSVRTRVLLCAIPVSLLYGMPPATAAQRPTGTLIEEIVVTAQKREESLQDISLAVSAVTDQQLSDGQIENVIDIQYAIPNVHVGTDFGQAKLTIRGIGLDAILTGADPSVALHVDGAIVSQSFAQLGSFFDLERVEVLRGPQGTLYGRNSTGGSFNLISKRPSSEPEGYIRASLGNYDNVIVEGAVGGPVVENKVLGRFSLKTTNRSGFGSNEVSGKDIDDKHNQSARMHLMFLGDDEMDFLVSAEWHRENDASLSLKYIEPTFPEAVPGDGTDLHAIGVAGTARGKRNVASEIDYDNDRETWALTGTWNWKFSETWALQSITNYRDFDGLLLQDLDVSAEVIDFSRVQALGIESKHYSEELQFFYDGVDLEGLVAFYYFNEELIGNNRIGNNPALTPLTSPAIPFFPHRAALTDLAVGLLGVVDIESYAVFSNFTYDFSSQFNVNLGARYTYEDRSGKNLSWSAFRPPGSELLPFETHGDSDNVSIKLALGWHIAEDNLLYVSYSEGFKSGVILTGTFNEIAEPELVESIEIGLKSTLFDSRMQINAAAFYYDFSDLQVSRTIPDGMGSFTTLFGNAASATNKGVELEFNWLLGEYFHLITNIGYLHASFDDFVSVGNTDLYDLAILQQSGASQPPAPQQAGNSLPQAPKWTAYLRGEYTVPWGDNGTVLYGAEVAYTDDVFFTPFNDEALSEDSYSVVNANIRYNSPDERFHLNFWGKNLTDEVYFSRKFAMAFSRTIQGQLGSPRTYGITIGYDF